MSEAKRTIGAKHLSALCDRVHKADEAIERKDAALRLMLEALEDLTTVTVDFSKIDAAIAAGREALK